MWEENIPDIFKTDALVSELIQIKENFKSQKKHTGLMVILKKTFVLLYISGGRHVKIFTLVKTNQEWKKLILKEEME